MTYHRIMLSMSILDVIHSFFAGTMVTVLVTRESGAWGAMGNRWTCSFQGFCTQIGLGVLLYNASLSIYFLMMVRMAKKPRSAIERVMRVVEPSFHLIPLYSFNV